MSEHWDNVSIKDVNIPVAEGELYVGQKIPIGIDVYLGDISPDDVDIELVSGRLNAQEQIVDFAPVVLSQSSTDRATQNGVFKFSGEVTLLESGRFGISARVMPRNENLLHAFRPKLISWW
jgi:starch phosphorylase